MTAPSTTFPVVMSHGADMLFRYVMAAGLLVVATPVAGAILPAAPPALDLAAHFLVPSMLLGAVLFVIGFLTGRTHIAVAAACLLLAGSMVLAPHLLSPGRMAAAAQSPRVPSIKLYFHNIWSNNRQNQAVAGSAAASGADVVVLAETSSWRWRHLAPGLTSYPNTISCKSRNECDLTLFSRHPLRDQVVFHDRITGARGIAATIGDPGHGQVRVVGVHLGRPIPPDGHDQQFLQAAALLRSDLFRPDIPTVLIGDFNAVPWGQLVGAFAQALQLHPAGGVEGSWPDFLPAPLRIRIDQALVSPGIAVSDQSLGDAVGSDHRSLSLTIGPSD
jgi:endonuclease/exonuclease/phosphatase (EEP) superfamily protein YafD